MGTSLLYNSMAPMKSPPNLNHVPEGYLTPLERDGKERGIFLNIFIVAFLLVCSYSFLQLANSTAIILGLGIIGVWRHGWGIINFARAVHYKSLASRQHKTQITTDGSLVVVVTFYNQNKEEVTAVTKALADAVFELPIPIYLICAHRTDDQRSIFEREFKSRRNTALNFCRQNGLGKREALADCLTIAKSSYFPKTREKSCVLLIDGDTIVTQDAIEQSIAHLQQDRHLGAVVVNEIPFSKGSQLFNQWRMLRSLERNKLMCSFALSGRVLVLTGRFCMYRGDIILQNDVINRLRKDFIRLKDMHISLLTGDDKTTWLEVIRRKKLMRYLPYSYIFPIEAPNLTNGFVRCTYRLTNRYSGNMARANLHKDAWIGVKHTHHFAFGLLDQRISMWTGLLTPLTLLYLLLFNHFGIFIVVLTYTLLIKHVQALALWLLSGKYDPWYPYLIFYNQVLSSLIKVRAFAYLHRQSWTNQEISTDENTYTLILDRKARSNLILRTLIFLSLFTLLYFLLR